MQQDNKLVVEFETNDQSDYQIAMFVYQINLLGKNNKLAMTCWGNRSSMQSLFVRENKT